MISFVSRLCIAALLLSASQGFALERLEDERDYLAVRQAMADGVFEVAAVKAHRLLERDGWGRKHEASLAALWVEALIRCGKGEEALAAIKEHELDNPDFWQGQALLLTHDFDAATEAFEKAAATTKPDLAPWVTIGRTHALMGEGRESTARTVIKPLRDHSDPVVSKHARLLFNELEITTRTQTALERLSREKEDANVKFLHAKGAVQLDDLKTGERELRHLLQYKGPGMGPHLHDAATVLLAEVLWKQHSAEARTTLLAFLNSFNSSNGSSRDDTEFWGEAFTLLDKIALSNKPDSTLLSAVFPWSMDAKLPIRQGYALHFIATEMHRLDRDEEAAGLLESLIQQHPTHPKTSDAMRLAMQIHGIAHNDARVLELAERWQENFGGGGESVVDFLVGLIHFMRGDYRDALNSFTKSADGEDSLAGRRRALYNAAVCAIKAGQKTMLRSLMTQLSVASVPDPAQKPGTPAPHDTAADLDLDRALQLAAKLDPGAESELKSFIIKHPDSPRIPEAHIAMAEFRLLDVPPRTKEAAEALANAAKGTMDAALQERIAYVQLWLREAEQDLSGAVREARSFLANWPDSDRADEVRMKLAEAYYRLEKYAFARTEFERLANDQPNSPYAEAALYFAGMSAIAVPTEESINAAISIWVDLEQRGGPLAFAARQQQAIATRLQGNYENALKLYNALLESTDAKGEQRLGIQSDVVELLIVMGKKDPARNDEAVKMLQSLLKTPSLPYIWSARFGVLLATILHDQGHNGEALEACYDVVSVGTNIVTSPQNPGEYALFYRAGFLAIDLLEASQQWEAAANMAEKLARSSGDRAKEAGDRASKIRLKHFLWDGSK